MLHDFIAYNREAIIKRSREKLTNRPWPLASTSELEHGIPLFLTQLAEALQQNGAETAAQTVIGSSAAMHGRELRTLGFNVSQVVHDYGDICQAITELAIAQNAPITTEEFHTLNRCLDTAIAEAVTEHASVTAQLESTEELERSGHLAHEIRNLLSSALLAFQALKRGTVAINGSTGAVLGRSLTGLRDLVDGALSEIRVATSRQRRERLPLAAFLQNVAVAAALDAEYRGVQFAIGTVDHELIVSGDPQLLASALMNLLNNAIKFTRTGGRIVLRAHRDDQSARIEIEDECGGIPDDLGDPFQPFGRQAGKDRTGLGLGLSIARKAVRAHGGDIHVRNIPDKGCVFIVDLPLADHQIPAVEARLTDTAN